MKTALITGANKRIGHEVARQLAAKGFHVFVGARITKAGRKTEEEIAKKCGKATFLEIDVSDNDSVTNAASEFSNMKRCLDVLVNNAGIIVDGDNAVLEMSDDLFRKTLEMTERAIGIETGIALARSWRTRKHPIFMPESYPCYPRNPRSFRDFDKIVASLAPILY